MTDSVLSELAQSELRHRGFRMIKDKAFGATMAIGGVTVIVAIVTIFFYLLYVVVPLFQAAHVKTGANARYDGPAPVRLELNEYADLAFAVSPDGRYRFVRTANGDLVSEGSLLPDGETAERINASTRTPRTVALGLAGGGVVLAKPAYVEHFRDGRRETEPSIVHPLGADPVDAVPAGDTVALLAAEAGDDGATIAAITAAHTLYLTAFTKTESLLEEEATFESTQVEVEKLTEPFTFLLMDTDQQELYLATPQGAVRFFDIRDKEAPRLVQELQVVPDGVTVTAVEFLSGGTSLLIGDSRGQVTQWFPVRDAENNLRLTRVREFFAFDAPVDMILPEYFRKGFVAIDARGTFGLFHTTAERTLLVQEALFPRAPIAGAMAPHANAVVTLDGDGTLATLRIRNRHPEVSWGSLWGKVWYEGRSAPEFVWQSSSASSDFEPKFSLTPLAFGTIKAAVYAMLFAIPIAVFGAVYTAYFMQPRMRAIVKPSIEIMAALPTVILGFLAGLWLAPLIETHLIGVLTATALMPVAIFVAAWGWSRAPDGLRHRVPEGTEVLLIVPVVCAVLWVTMAVSQPLEQLLFDGNLPRWLSQELGITYDQRNSLVVGIAMGFAVIPNIFSISEDAVFGVPRQLSTGSLALGATSWQTVTRVVLLTASPGIFSAIMIGLGRAVGETMIVLMSTGNTPIMDLNIFQGFRALSANIAVEMPESEVNSTHYRVLFLAALVLFGVTFLFNTVAEIVRQRLRAKYGNL
ncbi:MAG: ABC transporter permease subunit [Gammaproteobacteria bacterium]